MAYILGDIAAKVRNRIRDTGFSPTETTDAINDCINDVYNEYRLTFMQANQTYTVTVGVSDITNGGNLPTDFVEAINLTLTTAGKEKLIDYEDFTTIDETYPDPDDTTRNPTGPPASWRFYSNTIRLFPAPDAAYTLLMRYYKRPTLLSADSEIPSIPSEFQELIVSGAAYRILQVKDQYDQAAIHQNKYDEILAKLVMRYSPHQVGRPTMMRINRGYGNSRRIDSYNRIG
jgi:hypothetical protein